MQKDTNSNESKLIQGILELRTKLNEGSINQRQYVRGTEKLLVDVDDDTHNRFDELEQAFDNGKIDHAEYENRLAAIFPPVNQGVLATSRPDDAYDVFLSYSHKDAAEYDAVYINRIKTEIEKSLEGIVPNPRVFLDTDALGLGVNWHSTIMESLRQCLAFVCLLSENYLESGYSTRERIWWKARQTHDGRLLDGLYPIYYVKLHKDVFDPNQSDDVKNLVAIQMDKEPWFEFKTTLQEDFIKARLAAVTGVVQQKVSAALKAVSSFCSVTPLCEAFVGRITELRELHELCANGKRPVIHAAGGVGKTELAIAYAYGFADQYQGGRYLVRMEGVKDWKDAFVNLLNAYGQEHKDASPIKTWQYLGIDEKIMIGNDAEKKREAGRNALFEQAEKKGALLLLLDNVDDERILNNLKELTGGLSLPRNIHVLATTRMTLKRGENSAFDFQPYPQNEPLGNLKENEAFEMLCKTAGEGVYPFDRRQPPEKEIDDPEYHAAHEVIRYLECHAWSMEIVSAFMKENYRANEFNFARELEELKQNTKWVEADENGQKRHHAACKPEDLLKPTFDQLGKLPLGAETLELAVFAACFKADDIPVVILREYWQLHFTDNVTIQGQSLPAFAYALNQLTKYHLLSGNDKTCKMHRLLQSVLL